MSVYSNDQGAWIFPGQLCRNMGIDPNGQRQNIERKHWSKGWTCMTHVQLPGDGQSREQFALHERRLPMWIATIDTSRIKDPEVRANVERHQTEFADVLYEYLVRGGVINPDATYEQVEQLHARIAEIRNSEKHVHRKLTDLIAETAVDYDSSSDRVRKFFGRIQNVLLYAASGAKAEKLRTTREIVYYTGRNGPTKRDRETAKNYLDERELKTLEKLVGVFFDLADIRVMFRDDVNLELWRDMLNQAIRTSGRPVLDEIEPAWTA
ncbi:P22-like antirepressor protein [Haloactinospora alba]|uniref:P22-like antirepressor protein n=1 Tax=Haloactinospora alba TaxID=405555 RepID=A0A543N2N7_9ACTN|nr:P22-like antirepressor protein [Haloactinospora alba]